jgi:signal peptidase I
MDDDLRRAEPDRLGPPDSASESPSHPVHPPAAEAGEAGQAPPAGASSEASTGATSSAWSEHAREVPATVAVAAEEPESPAGGAHAAERRKGGSFLKELPFLIVIALVLALLIKAFLIQAFYIPSGSMEQTLRIGDRVLVNKLVYRFRDVHRGDIVVFKGPESWAPEVQLSEPTNPVARFFHSIGGALGFAPAGEKDFFKRVIGVPGDTVACCDSQGRVTVNGHGLDEPFLYQDNHEAFGPVKVPKGDLWVMGDHRSLSADSRAHIGDSRHGTIPISDVVGRAFVVVWPISHGRGLGTPATFHQKGLAAAGLAATPYALGVVGALPLATLRRRRRRRRAGR